MSQKTVLLLDSIHIDGKEILQKHFNVLEMGGSQERLMAEIVSASAVVVRTTKIPDEMIMAGTKLEVIGKHGVGMDNINIPLATAKGILVVNTPLANIISVAEHTMALMFAVAKRIIPANYAMQSGVFTGAKGDLTHLAGERGLMGMEVFGKHLGVVGMGKIGREVALRGKGLGMRVAGYDPWVKLEQVTACGVERLCDGVQELAAESDVLSINIPLNDATRNIINAAVLAVMPSGAILINCARGGIVDETALAAAVRSGRLMGAGVDVFAQEPPTADCPLFGIDGIVLTPHRAGGTKESVRCMAVTIAEECSAILNGRQPRFIANPQVLAMKNGGVAHES